MPRVMPCEMITGAFKLAVQMRIIPLPVSTATLAAGGMSSVVESGMFPLPTTPYRASLRTNSGVDCRAISSGPCASPRKYSLSVS